jgi:tetratricopeptide (TPR) repeat protein
MDSTGRPLSTSSPAGRLPEAIRAARAGQREEARTLLLQIVEDDENNELAWLWLSGVVEADEERRVCLENVLALNPNNEAARRGLAKLEPAATAASEAIPVLAEAEVVRREITPVSPAAAVLYPERQVQEWEWRDPTSVVRQVELPGFVQESTFDDVWNSNKELCGYCAGVLGFDEKRCPQCGRNLMTARYRQEKPSTNMHVFWVLLLGAAQLHLAQGIINFIYNPNELGIVILHGVIALVLTVLTLFVYLRHFWAYTTSLIVLALLMAITVLNVVSGEAIGEFINGLIGNEATRELATEVTVPLIADIVSLVRILLLAATVLALGCGVFFVGPDFARDTTREIAEVSKGQRFASDFYGRGQDHARQGRWATAVLYYQRASAHEPHQVYYQKALGQAYAVLGFYQRSLDVLESAEKMTSNQTLKAEMSELIRRVKEHQAKKD